VRTRVDGEPIILEVPERLAKKIARAYAKLKKKA
jgi:hypothetical protein